MPHRDTSLSKAYINAHPEKAWEIYLWTNLANHTDHAHRIGYAYEDWLKTDRSEPAPDLAKQISIYGYMRLRIVTWKLPIELTPEEMQRWSESGYYVTTTDFHKAIGTVAGSVVYALSEDIPLAIQIIQTRLEEKFTELERLVALPIDSYTPEEQEWQIIERLRGENVSEERFELAMEDERSEAAHTFFEVPRFDKPFKLRDELESFEWGMEMLRLLVLGEVAPKAGLPNRELFSALLQIDINALNARLHDIDEKLRVIWRNLADYDCYCINAEHEPERFWWRHFPRAKTSRRTRRPQTGKPTS